MIDLLVTEITFVRHFLS